MMQLLLLMISLSLTAGMDLDSEYGVSMDIVLRVSRIYHDAIRSAAHITASDGEIDRALRSIILRSTSDERISETEPERGCIPRAHILSQEDIRNALYESSTRLKYMTGPIITDQKCLRVERCSKHSGCCHDGGECSAKAVVNATFDIQVSTGVPEVSFTEQIQFESHTSCYCKSPINKCVCPVPYVPEMSADQYSCRCRCPATTASCANLTEGRTSLDWTKTRPPWYSIVNDTASYGVYKQCIERSPDHHAMLGMYCPLPECLDGLGFDLDLKRCMPMQGSHISHSVTNNSNMESELLAVDSNNAYQTIPDISNSGQVLTTPANSHDYDKLSYVHQTTTSDSEIIVRSLSQLDEDNDNGQIIDSSTQQDHRPLANIRQTEIEQRRKELLRSKIERKLRLMERQGVRPSLRHEARLIKKLIREVTNIEQRLKVSQYRDCKVLNLELQNEAYVRCQMIPKNDYIMLQISNSSLFCTVDVV